ncbi:MAG: DUF3365 domain-containing protein [bacterium]|nr:DUF3365 domain-containing protein [bacterium]
MRNREYIFAVFIFWTAILAISLAWNMYTIKKNTLRLFTSIGRAFFKEIETTRSWNARHGGVYVKITEATQPNPYLTDPDRDVVAKNGQLKLTKINPAYMTRQIAEIAEERNDIHYHITSLKPIRPANKGDDWEKKVMEMFENNRPPLTEFIEKIESKDVYRYMASLSVEKACLACHGQQGAVVGEVRGG